MTEKKKNRVLEFPCEKTCDGLGYVFYNGNLVEDADKLGEKYKCSTIVVLLQEKKYKTAFHRHDEETKPDDLQDALCAAIHHVQHLIHGLDYEQQEEK